MNATLFSVLFWACAASGAVFYVDPSAGNDASAGTSTGTAWKHVPGDTTGGPQRSLVNGDVINVKGGSVINASIAIVNTNYSGASAYDSIIIQSGELLGTPWGTGKVIVDGQNTRTYGVAFNTISGVTVDDFEIRNIAAGSSAWGGNGSAGVELGAGNGFSFVTIRRCYIHDCLRTLSDQGHGMEADHGDHLLVYYNSVGPHIGTKGIEPNAVNQGVISNNFVGGTGDHCVSLTRTTNFDVCNNLIAQAGPQVHEPTYCISTSLAQNCDVWNNVMYDAASSLTNTFEASGGIGVYANSPSLTIGDRFYHNTLYALIEKNNGSVSTAVRIGDDSTSQLVTNITLMNNLVVACSNIIGLEQFFLRPIGTTNDTVSFNDFWGSSAGQTVMSFGNSPYTYQTVAAYSPGAGLTYANNQQLDPLFTAGTLPTALTAAFLPNTTFFALQPTAPTSVRATGNTLTGDTTHGYNHSSNKFAFDITGLPRLNWSMGAYEWSSFPPPPYAINVIMSGKTLVTGKVFIQ